MYIVILKDVWVDQEYLIDLLYMYTILITFYATSFRLNNFISIDATVKYRDLTTCMIKLNNIIDRLIIN